MFRLLFTTEAQPRWKNGRPAHSTTGVDSPNSIQAAVRGAINLCRPSDGMWPPISSANTGAVRTSPIQSRRFMSASSGFGDAPAVTTSGSSAMPQIGHAPGPARRIWGCIGQV